MGSFITRILDSFSEMKAKILLLGLDGAGKTTILYQMKFNEVYSSVPTIGFNVEEVKYKGLTFTVWDIGGQTKLRGLWHHYFDKSNAIVYVLDASDAERVELARETLQWLLSEDELKQCPILLFANKMDISSLRPQEIVEKLGMHQLRQRQWHMQPCCALNGQGIAEGFEWLRKEMKKSKN